MGAGLVWIYAVVVMSSSWALTSPHGVAVSVLNMIMGSVLAAIAFAVLRRARLSATALLLFPMLLLIMEVVLVATTSGLANEYTGFFTLAFIFIGLTQSRGTAIAFALVVGPAWVYCQQGFTSQVGIRLGMALAIWIIIGEVLADRAHKSRAMTAELIAQASTDVLTGLDSRLTMSDRLDRTLAEQAERSSSLVLLDLDGFKAINDAFGHAVGDELLIVLANRIQACVGSEDRIARLGGDEFAVYLHECGLSDAVRVGERLLLAIAEPVDLTRGRVGITASVGVVDLASCASTAHAMRNVDVAMSEAKVAGKNRVAVFQADMQQRIESRLRLETELRVAVDEEQFEVYYQPSVNAETLETVGFEALIRWQHPRRGLLAASEFIDVCEDIGLVVPLGRWILRTACRHARLWQPIDPARRLTMAVNLSARQLFDTDMVTEVRNALAEFDLPGGALVLEITERLLLVDSPFVLRQLKELKELGVRIAIDDFGTGYSSLAYLRDFPIDILKIDRSFIAPLGEDRQAIALVRSIIGIADALDLDVIAEGAETVAQVELLTQSGCMVIQGYYFGQPSAAEDISRYFSSGPLPSASS